ncbi:glutamine-hydrolyzing carbamoyl-phosphate synthase small subunit [Persephonella atlantica]|uniref:Carbamoyl phosphate synthase small chain n=1 Tax=Persephonella atlantica TaxID=2699429 RepID=A0ABS1GH90_9AQUI|nr:glutamine-hydrolyzing carbamoyl-phosphate synthase small subunit [Persephonella atlantica]MBK3332313.1 glutamine-hydrolyzing carbamoyl-phosphate synthase small subunit [Persephonella atlantica]
MEKAILALEDGHFFYGYAFSGFSKKETGGEVIFNTSMTGYQEILTDPSYKGQIVVMTPSEVGNYGVNFEDLESEKVHVNGFVIKDLSSIASNWRAEKTLQEYLDESGVIGVCGIDTRALVRIIRKYGVMKGYIHIGEISPAEAVKRARNIPDISELDLVSQVSHREVYRWNEGTWRWPEGYRKINEKKYTVAVIDYGVKRNILRLMADRGMELVCFPSNISAEEVLKFKPDGIFLSNGPGDPAILQYQIEQIKKLLSSDIPMFGICLGHQLLSWAIGGKTYKLEFGHHGGNHPVKDLRTGKVEITAQNHNYATDPDSLPSHVEITHINLNDDTIEGIRLTDRPAFSIQHHPEASPGPHDSNHIFDDFVRLIEECKNR